jgi:serine/threonine protein kinase
LDTHILPFGHLLHQRYTIQSTIGQGGFGITYLAYDQKLDQEVCIKELFVSGNSTRGSNLTVHSQSTGDFSFADFVQRFVQEARQLARFQHPNIVRVIDVFEENQTAYMIMEYVKGETLKQKIQRAGVINEIHALQLISQLLGAVNEIHKKGMLHRDIKPDNILITPEDRVVLIDFGSAREFAEGKTSSQTAMITPGYAPPEQYSERARRGPFTDIYALGATLYFILTGEKPIAATDRTFEELIPPYQINPKVSSQVSSAVMLAMELKPEDRFQTVSDLKEAMNSLLDNSRGNIKAGRSQSDQINKSSLQPKKRTNKLALVFSLFSLAVIIGIIAIIVEFGNGYENYDFDGDIEIGDDSGGAIIPGLNVPIDVDDELIQDEFVCGSGDTVPLFFINDGDCDCNDCSDENPFECFGGKYIPRNWLNDGDCDCLLCDDEDN